MANWTLRNKLQWKFNRNSNTFIQKNAFESVVCEMTAILYRPQSVNMGTLYWWNDICILRRPLLQLTDAWVMSPWAKWPPFRRGYFRCIFVNEKFRNLIKISLKCVLEVPICNNPALVSKMVRCRIDYQPLSEPMMTRFTDAYMRYKEEMS